MLLVIIKNWLLLYGLNGRFPAKLLAIDEALTELQNLPESFLGLFIIKSVLGFVS
jgi:hypothetical protein